MNCDQDEENGNTNALQVTDKNVTMEGPVDPESLAEQSGTSATFFNTVSASYDPIDDNPLPTPLITEEIASAMATESPYQDNDGQNDVALIQATDEQNHHHVVTGSSPSPVVETSTDAPPPLLLSEFIDETCHQIEILDDVNTTHFPAVDFVSQSEPEYFGHESREPLVRSDQYGEAATEQHALQSEVQLADHEGITELHHNDGHVSVPLLDDLLRSIDSENEELSVGRTLLSLKSTALTHSDIDDLLLTFGVAIPPSHWCLHQAVLQRNLSVIYLLMRSDYRRLINERDPHGRTPWHIALLNADSAALQLMLSMPIGPIPFDVESGNPNIYDTDFPDLSLSFARLPAIQLPLNKAGWSDNRPDVLATYSLLFSFADLCRRVREREADKNLNGLELLINGCGWCNDVETDENGPGPQSGLDWALEQLSTFLETRADSDELGLSIDAKDGWGKQIVMIRQNLKSQGATALHKASDLGVAQIVEVLLDAGANPLLKDCNGDLPVHRAVDSADPDTFALLLRRGGTALVIGGSNDERGCDPWSEDTSMIALFRRCILRGSWRCLGRLVMDEVYSQFPIPETAVDGLLEFANLCGYNEEFSDAFRMAVDDATGLVDEPLSRDRSADTTQVKFFTHDDCFQHLPLPTDMDRRWMKRLKLYARFPENPSRLHCLTPLKSGILRTSNFSHIPWEENASKATMADILRVHDWSYIRSITEKIQKAQIDARLLRNTKPFYVDEVDGDTPITPQSWEAATRAAGAVIAAAKSVCKGETRQAFCAVRPPGHHVGTWGACQPPTGENLWSSEEEDWVNGSQGFCLLNNVAIGAAYTRYHFSSMGIRRIAIIDFDVHHGNGTEQILMNVKPRKRKLNVIEHHPSQLTAKLEISSDFWKVWLDESDADETFFASIHGFGERFYPGTGGIEERAATAPNVHNVLLEKKVTREQFRSLFCSRIIDPLYSFQPDIIFISAGFDAHSHDVVNEGFGPCSEFDYYWVTRLIVSVANTCCNGRTVSVLEGGYNTKACTLSPLAQSVAYHVKALIQTPSNLNLDSAKLLDTLYKQMNESSSSYTSVITDTDDLMGNDTTAVVVTDNNNNNRSVPADILHQMAATTTLLTIDGDNDSSSSSGLSNDDDSSHDRKNDDSDPIDEIEPKRRRRAAAVKALAHIEERQVKLKDPVVVEETVRHNGSSAVLITTIIMDDTRIATHAGSWYPSTVSVLNKQIEDFIKCSGGELKSSNKIGNYNYYPKAIICPHAGYQYCGSTGAYGWNQLSHCKNLQKLFILGPSHLLSINGGGLPNQKIRKYQTPLGELQLDTEYLKKLLSKSKYFQELSKEEDEAEHSIELQLPFVYYVLKKSGLLSNVKIIPILIGSITRTIATTMTKMLTKDFENPSTLFLISSDFCHWGHRFHYRYLPKLPTTSLHHDINSQIQSLDNEAIKIIKSHNSEDFWKYLDRTKNTICGENSIKLLLMLIESSNLKLTTFDLHYSQSSTIANPDRDTSVSYASLLTCIQTPLAN